MVQRGGDRDTNCIAIAFICSGCCVLCARCDLHQLERREMNPSVLKIIVSFASMVPVTAMAASNGAPTNAGDSRSINATTKAQTQALKKPDLTVQPAPESKLPIFTVKNVGNANAGPFMVQVQCHTVSGAACLPDIHYGNVPASPPSPGTMMTAPNVWRIPVAALNAAGGQVKLHLSVLPKNQPSGLKFNVCADTASTVSESSESNNCAIFVFKPLQ